MILIRDGYKGLMNGHMEQASWSSVAGVLQRGGTFLGTSRSEAFRTKQGRCEAAYQLVSRDIDTLLVVGGDGSLSGAQVLADEWHEHLCTLSGHKVANSSKNFNVDRNDRNVDRHRISMARARSIENLHLIGMVGSIDNDMCGTDLTIGADSALQRICGAIDLIISTAASHQRHFIVEVMGRNCGWLALMAALATGSDWVFIPEIPVAADWDVRLARHLRTGDRTFNIIVISEGALDHNGEHIGSGDVRDKLAAQGIDSRVTVLGHVQRGGSPSAIDRIYPTLLGAHAIEAALESEPSVALEPVLMGVAGRSIVRLPLRACLADTHRVPKLIAARQWPAVAQLRTGSFSRLFSMLCTFTRPSAKRAERAGGMRIAVVHSGAVAPGMNAAARGIVRLAANDGHSVFGVSGGFAGLAAGHVEQLRWRDVSGWTLRAGAVLKTRRDGVLSADDIERVARVVAEHRFDALVMVGGWNGYAAMMQLHASGALSARTHLMCVPATISCALPGTADCIGADTALNVIVDAVSSIKSSAAAARRVYVVEVMGRRCGFLATLGGLATGAEKMFVPEQRISLASLQRDVDTIKAGFTQFGHDMALVLTTELADQHRVFTPDFIASLLLRESDELFSVRTSKLGHTQQGAAPSPRDRVLALDLAHHCVGRLVGAHRSGAPIAECVGFSVLGKPLYAPIADIPKLMDLAEKRPHDQWWHHKISPYIPIFTAPAPSSQLASSTQGHTSALRSKL
jgi:6-phosphofructokinase 1